MERNNENVENVVGNNAPNFNINNNANKITNNIANNDLPQLLDSKKELILLLYLY